MALFTTSYFKDLARSASRSTFESRTLNESKSLRPQFDIFLSHSFSDKQIIKGVFIELSKQGFIVYVDWIVDPNLNRSSVDQSTASIIRKRMRQSKSLIYATSPNAAVSKWMQWELGYMDGFTKEQCALLPISDSSQESFKGREFLSLYPYIDKGLSIYKQGEYSFSTPTYMSSLKNWI